MVEKMWEEINSRGRRRRKMKNRWRENREVKENEKREKNDKGLLRISNCISSRLNHEIRVNKMTTHELE
jgi:hypothetical protein